MPDALLRQQYSNLSFSFHFLSLTAAHSCACTHPSELSPPLCPLAVVCLSHVSKLSALLRCLPSFPNDALPSAISFLQFHSKSECYVILLLGVSRFLSPGPPPSTLSRFEHLLSGNPHAVNPRKCWYGGMLKTKR